MIYKRMRNYLLFPLAILAVTTVSVSFASTTKGDDNSHLEYCEEGEDCKAMKAPTPEFKIPKKSIPVFEEVSTEDDAEEEVPFDFEDGDA